MAGTWEDGWTAKELVELSHLERSAEATGAAHVLRAWVRTEVRAWKSKVEMEAKIAAQTKAIEQRDLEIVGLNEKVREEREFFVDNLLVRIHFIIAVIRWTRLVPPQPFEFPFPGSLTSTFLPGA